jgi:hypothetical protein
MSHMPKSKQRAIDKANRERERLASAGQAPGQNPRPLVTPRRLDSSTMPVMYCRGFDVYFNGAKQTMVKIADAGSGTIERFKDCVYDERTKMMRALPPYTTETLHGKVEIRRKGK